MTSLSHFVNYVSVALNVKHFSQFIKLTRHAKYFIKCEIIKRIWNIKPVWNASINMFACVSIRVTLLLLLLMIILLNKLPRASFFICYSVNQHPISYLFIQSRSSISTPPSSPKSVRRRECSPTTLILRPSITPVTLDLEE